MATKKTPRPPMSNEHKAALAAGRQESRIVKRYLEALEAHKPKRGRKRTADSIKKRLAAIENELAVSEPLNRVSLVQERMDLEDELAAMGNGSNLDELEHEFVGVARDYSSRKGISYAAWRQVGVSPAVLKQAGITRSM